MMGFVLKLAGNPLYLAIAAALIFAAGAASGGLAGWKTQGWRMGAQLEVERGKVAKLQAENAVYAGANARCAVDVVAVQKAVKGVVDEGLRIAEQARVAMDRAAKTSAGHLGRAETILQQLPVAPERWCEAIMAEQRAYIDQRRLERGKR